MGMAKRTEFHTILFDLDGTITDSALGITKCIAYAAQKMGLACPPLEKLKLFVGPPLRATFQSFFQLTQEEATQAVAYYRERFSTIGMYENTVYNGMADVLKNLSKAGYILLLASSKPEKYVRTILDHFQLSEYFSYIGGSQLDGGRSEKAEVIQYVLSAQGIQDRTGVIMVGDTHFDMEGAKKCGIATMAVGYGYGEKEKLLFYEPTFYAETVQALSDYFLTDVRKKTIS